MARDENGREYKEQLEALTDRLVHLHRALYAERRQALLVVLQARDAAGKDSLIKKVFGPLDPLDFFVHSFRKPTEDELRQDYLWRVHLRVPPKGAIAIFNRSHYEDVLPVRVYGLVPREEWERRYDQINAFERHLAENRVTLLKFYLDISRDEQRRQMLERLDDPEKTWKFNPGDLDDRDRWDDFTAAYDELLRRCSTPWAPWHVVPGDDRRARNLTVARTVVETLERMAPRIPGPDPSILAHRARLA
ncbi:MAG TPA: PPK2 family polyphosphate kinase [Gemmatimonadales bacterium]|nr:PPK2 family polyphosphate kinase [Gemmatimonadales bacterium]